VARCGINDGVSNPGSFKRCYACCRHRCVQDTSAVRTLLSVFYGVKRNKARVLLYLFIFVPLIRRETGYRSWYSDQVTGWTVRGSVTATTPTPVLGPIQTPVQWIPGALFQGITWPVCNPDHSSSCSAEVKIG